MNAPNVDRAKIVSVNDSPLSFESSQSFQQWLEQNHSRSDTIWLRLRKKGSNLAGLTHAEALEIALCYGWIDGQIKRGDEHYFQQRFGPRSRASIWSKINSQSALRLMEAGQMKPSGMAEIERAQTDGRWDRAYEPQSRATVPADLQAALDSNPKAKDFFAKLNSKNRYAILFRLQLAKKAETRARRLATFIAMLSEGRTFHEGGKVYAAKLISMAETEGTARVPTLPRSYTEDYAGWIEDTACAIEEGRFGEIDRVALADEVRDLGKTERRELRSALEVLLMHMLKTRYQSEKKTRGWGLTMRVQRQHIAEFLRESPSLRRELPQQIAAAYGTARIRAADETGLEEEVFPEECEWTVAEVLAV